MEWHTGEDVQLLAWDVIKGRHINLEVLGDHFLWNMRQPILHKINLNHHGVDNTYGKQECGVFTKGAVVKDQEELSTISCSVLGLNTMGESGREVP